MRTRDLMIPASDCARVAEERTIYDAVVMLEAWRQRFQSEYRPRVVLVQDRNFRIIGSLRHFEMLRALSTGRAVSTATYLTPAGSAEASALAALSQETDSWDKILTHLSDAAHRVRVKDAMYHYQESEYIDENASAEELLSRMLSGPFINLVVTSGAMTTGIVRLSDVYSMVCREIKRSGMK